MLQSHDVAEIINFTKTTIKLMHGFLQTTQNLLSVAVPVLGDHENWRQKYNFDSRETKVQRLTTVFSSFQ